MRRRGVRVDTGSRLEYVVTKNKGLRSKLFDKLEDPSYQKKFSEYVFIDFLYYVKQLINPIDQLLSISFDLHKYMDKLYKVHLTKCKLNKEIMNYHIRFV